MNMVSVKWFILTRMEEERGKKDQTIHAWCFFNILVGSMFYRDVLPDFAGIVAAPEETSPYRASLAMFFAIAGYSWSLYLPFDRSEKKNCSAATISAEHSS